MRISALARQGTSLRSCSRYRKGRNGEQGIVGALGADATGFAVKRIMRADGLIDEMPTPRSSNQVRHDN